LSVSLLTVVPVRADRVDRETAGQAMLLAPAVGLAVGGVAAVVLIVAGWLELNRLLAVVLALAAMAVLTRGLHLDGLADVADGLGAGPRGLEVMKRSDIGPFGVVTLIFTVLVQMSALVQSGHGPLIVMIAAVTGRLALPWACRETVPAARPEGLGALVAGSVRQVAAAGVTGVVLVLAAMTGILAGGARGAVLAVFAVLAGLAVAAAMLAHTVRRFGGITGDVLGSLVELGTAAALIMLAPL